MEINSLDAGYFVLIKMQIAGTYLRVSSLWIPQNETFTQFVHNFGMALCSRCTKYNSFQYIHFNEFSLISTINKWTHSKRVYWFFNSMRRHGTWNIYLETMKHGIWCQFRRYSVYARSFFMNVVYLTHRICLQFN